MSDIPLTADPGETPTAAAAAGPTVDLTAAHEVDAADVRPELLAQSLGEYLRVWWLRVRSGDSGVLPVVLGIVVVAISFQIANSTFLSSQNLVNLFEQSTIYMLLAIAEIFVLLLAEIDLSVGLVMALSGAMVAELVQPDKANWPWWAAIIVALLACAAVGAIQGWLVARLKMPSFIVTLGGLLILEGIAIIVLGGNGLSASATPTSPARSCSTTSSGATSARLLAGSCWPCWSEPPARGSGCERPVSVGTASRARRVASPR